MTRRDGLGCAASGLLSSPLISRDVAMNGSLPMLEQLHTRNSAPRLTSPAPTEAEVEEMIRCALRSPDHCRLRPWRFLSCRGSRRDDLGELLVRSLLRCDPVADEAAIAKARGAPLRAPLVMAVFAVIQDHPKVPAWEQRVSAGCTAFAIELAAEAMGYAAVWRTGSYAGDRQLVEDLGGADNEEIVAFLYLGTRDGEPKPLPTLEPADFHRNW
jgi:nitroreductase